MKKVMSSLLSILLLAFMACGFSQSSMKPNIHFQDPTMGGCYKIVEIRQADIPLIIPDSATGTHYCLKESVVWNPVGGGSPTNTIPAVTILAKNIVLDLKGNKIDQNHYAGSVFTCAIQVGDSSTATEISNVVIKNGTVQNMGTFGILLFRVNNLLLEDINVLNNGLRGIGVNNPTSLLPVVAGIFCGHMYIMKNCTLRNIHCDFNGGTPLMFNGTHAINFGACLRCIDNLRMEHSTFDNTTATFLDAHDPAICGIALGFACPLANIINCSINNGSGPIANRFNFFTPPKGVELKGEHDHFRFLRPEYKKAFKLYSKNNI